MCDSIDGFLSENADDIRQVIRERYPKQSDLLRRLNRHAVSVQHSIEISLDSPGQQYSSCLFARTLATTQASVLLLERGLLSQAKMLLRCALETLFALGAVAKQPEIVPRLLDGHRAEQQRVAKSVPLWKAPELQEIADATGKAGLLNADYGGATAALSAFDLAQKAGLEDWYRTVYLVFSWPVHGAVADVGQHAETGPSGEIVAFKNEPCVEEQSSTWFCCIEVLLKAISFLAMIFPNVDQVPVEEMLCETHAIFGELAGCEG